MLRALTPNQKSENNNDVSVVIISIIPFLFGGKGHMYTYHLAVGGAARIIGWKHLVVCPNDPELSLLPFDWYPLLEGVELESRVIRSSYFSRILAIFYALFDQATSIVSFLNKNITKAEGVVLLIERFNWMQLLAFTLGIVCYRKKNIEAWLLFRHSPDTFITHSGLIYRLCIWILGIKLGKARLRLLTDSESLNILLKNYFKLEFTTMPIPHTHSYISKKNTTNDDFIMCWWAGPPRENKGWSLIRLIVCANNTSNVNICLLAARSSCIKNNPSNIRVVEVDDFLSPDAYTDTMSRIDVMLLPYSKKEYSASTSGIFVETVAAGKIPLVTDGTWLADELRRYNLAELIINWHDQNIWSNIVSICNSKETREKLLNMQLIYLEFHSQPSFARKMVQIKFKGYL